MVITASLDYAKIQQAMFSFGLGMQSLPLKKQVHLLRVAGVLPEQEQALTGFVRLLVPLDLVARGPDTGATRPPSSDSGARTTTPP